MTSFLGWDFLHFFWGWNISRGSWGAYLLKWDCHTLYYLVSWQGVAESKLRIPFGAMTYRGHNESRWERWVSFQNFSCATSDLVETSKARTRSNHSLYFEPQTRESDLALNLTCPPSHPTGHDSWKKKLFRDPKSFFEWGSRNLQKAFIFLGPQQLILLCCSTALACGKFI